MTTQQHAHKYGRIFILFCLTSCVFLNPFPHINSLIEILYYTAIALTLWLTVSPTTRPDFRSPLILPFLLFFAWALASVFWAFDRENTAHDVYGHLLKHIMLYFMLISFFVKKEHFLVLVWSVIASTTILSLSAIIYSYVIVNNPISYRVNIAKIGTNRIAQYCLIGALLSLFYIPVADKWRKKTALIICFLISMSSVILSYSRACLLALVIGCLFFIFFTKTNLKKPLIGATVLIIAVSISIFSLSPDIRDRFRISNDERTRIYITSLEMIKNKPIAGLGYGMQSFKQNYFIFNKFSPQKFVSQFDYSHPHNIFLDMMIRLGFVGLALFCWIFFRVFKMGRELTVNGKDPFVKHWGLAITSCFIALFTVGFFGIILNFRNSVLLYTLMAMMTILWKRHRYTESSPNL